MRLHNWYEGDRFDSFCLPPPPRFVLQRGKVNDLDILGANMSNSRYPTARTKDLVIQTLKDETLVYDITSHQAHCLNETAAFVWSKCTGKSSVDEIGRSITKRFSHKVNGDFVRLAITQLNERRLLSEGGSEELVMSDRRRALKKIALATAAVLPIIASVTAPTHAFAFTSVCSCLSNVDCFSTPQCGGNTCGPQGICVPGPVPESIEISL